ncbi:hypothetical protein DQ04_17731000, partial [Trypanosoma grayi]|uniref:hypothetical protein n=1 Tax=Trypanosoma grayi TaxID=71804 RepID=UPI0004F44AFE
ALRPESLLRGPRRGDFAQQQHRGVARAAVQQTNDVIRRNRVVAAGSEVPGALSQKSLHLPRRLPRHPRSAEPSHPTAPHNNKEEEGGGTLKRRRVAALRPQHSRAAIILRPASTPGIVQPLRNAYPTKKSFRPLKYARCASHPAR